MRGKEICKIAVGAGLLSMLLACGARAEDKDLPGPIHSIEDLQDVGKFLFKLADTNNDNRISQKEAIDAGNLLAGGFFFRADTNGDGVVTPDEARAAREALFNQRPLLRFIFQRSKEAINEQAWCRCRQTGENEFDECAGHEPRRQLLGLRVAPGGSDHRSEPLPDGGPQR